jgi:thiosulfate dehydrogenase
MQSNIENSLGFSTKMMLGLVSVLVVLVFTVLGLVINEKPSSSSNSTDSLLVKNYQAPDSNFTHLWEAPADWRLGQLDKNQRDLIHYGKDLIANTAEYLGPNGTVSHISNGMNCQNCHLNAGTKAWGNNYFAVASTYPKFRARSGKLESKEKRINDCFERSLNGKALDSTSKEMRAIVAYMDWVGSDVEKKHTPKGTGIFKLKLLKHAADPTKGAEVYTQKCQSCHQTNGQGILAEGRKKFTYPPLWGKNSYNDGAGLYRLSNLAGYVKYNMPLGVTYQNTQLSDEEAWDVAAYINSQTRPHKDLSQDWPKIADKPFDHPFGPYTDPFSELQHKYGPFKAIKDWKKKRN